MEGKLAVGTVIMNRVERRDYPDTIYGVIFDCENGVQFTPTANGTVYLEPDADSVRAAKMCLEGYRVPGNLLFFIDRRPRFLRLTVELLFHPADFVKHTDAVLQKADLRFSVNDDFYGHLGYHGALFLSAHQKLEVKAPAFGFKFSEKLAAEIAAERLETALTVGE